MAEAEVIDPKHIGLGISFQIPLDKMGRTIVFQTHVPQTAERAAVNEFVDKVAAVAKRQADRAHHDELAMEVALLKRQVAEAEASLERVDDRHKSEWARANRSGALRLTPVQQQQRDQVVESIKRGRDLILIKGAEKEIIADRIKADAY